MTDPSYFREKIEVIVGDPIKSATAGWLVGEPN
jgi:hypothetical protein